MGFETVNYIVKEVYEAICRNMQNIYLPEPTTEIWEQSAKEMEKTWKFPNCIESIDGKHVTIECPSNSGSNYFCYLNKYSMVLLAIVGPDYRFLCVDIGGYGKNSDGGIFEESNMGQKFQAGLMNILQDKPLPGQYECSPHVLIGDEAFALRPYLMRPFPRRQEKVDKCKEIYNIGLSTARRVVENAFGILVQKWRIFLRPIPTKVETTILIVKTACILHNFLRIKKCDELYPEQWENLQSAEQQFQQENEIGALANMELDGRRSSNLAFEIRGKFVNYFNV